MKIHSKTAPITEAIITPTMAPMYLPLFDVGKLIGKSEAAETGGSVVVEGGDVDDSIVLILSLVEKDMVERDVDM